MKEYSLKELASHIDAELIQKTDCVINGLAPLNRAKPGQLSFLYDSRYKKHLLTTGASAVVLTSDNVADCPTNVLVASNPRKSLSILAHLFSEKPDSVPGIDPSAIIGERCHIPETVSIGPYTVLADDVTLGDGVSIGAHCVIGQGVHIGHHTQLHSNITVYYNVRIGERGLVHSGVVLGSDGFGMVSDDQGQWHKIPQLGTVVIGHDVEIGANTTIDRGTLDDTVIEEGVKLDNQIQIAHNVHIGKNTIIAGCTGIAGSVTIGANCVIAGAVGIADHVTIAEGVVLAGMSCVGRKITEPGIYASALGVTPYREWRRNMLRFCQLETMAKQLNELVKKSCYGKHDKHKK